MLRLIVPSFGRMDSDSLTYLYLLTRLTLRHRLSDFFQHCLNTPGKIKTKESGMMNHRLTYIHSSNSASCHSRKWNRMENLNKCDRFVCCWRRGEVARLGTFLMRCLIIKLIQLDMEPCQLPRP